jgi:hypothetical protein
VDATAEPGAFDIAPMWIAAQEGHTVAIEALGRLGADANRVSEDGRTPVYIAAIFGHASAIEALGLLGADTERAEGGGRTPVYAAAMSRMGPTRGRDRGAQEARGGREPGRRPAGPLRESESAHRLSGSRPAAAAATCLRLAAAWWPSPGVPPGPAQAAGRTLAGAWPGAGPGSRQGPGHRRVSSACASPGRRPGPGSSHVGAAAAG